MAGTRFTVKIIPRTLTGKGVDGRAMGVAPGTRETRGTLAYAFYDRIREVHHRLRCRLNPRARHCA
jgi:hypothetical protein